MKLWNLFRKAPVIIVRRLRTQGLSTTVIWFCVRSFDKLTGIPPLRFSQITPEICVGPQLGKRGKRYLERVGITGSINLRAEYDDAAYGLALREYCYLPTIDDEVPTPEQIQQGIVFIQQTLTAGGKVYIHCAGGSGRAPTMCMAYLISQGMGFDEAIALVRKARPFIQPSPAQMDYLRRLAEAQHPTQ